MDYAEAQAAFFQPRSPESPPQQFPFRSPARALRDAIEPLAAICWWAQPAYNAYAALGLDFLEGYVCSRASGLGDADPAVAAAAFGVFEPGGLAGLLQAGRAKAGLAEIRDARLSGAIASLREVLGDTDELAETVAVLRRGAAAGRPLGRPFYAGLTDLEWPQDPLGQLWLVCTMLREYRGDGHLACCVAAGLDGVEANLLTELWVGWTISEYTASRAWPEDEIAAATERLRGRGLIVGETLSDAGRAMRGELETATDATMREVIDAIGPELDAVTERAGGWAERVVERGWFPPDPYKRASG